jgi:glycosyltransferase involved in cell wall biosynthesis
LENSVARPLVSVVLACYNCEKYIEQAVESIINQAYRNLEILITDDCSTDNSYKILKQIAEKDNRIVLMRNETNLKLAKTLNNMIAVAKGKYIARMDADDISFSKRIEKQVEFMETYLDYAICGTNVWHINGNGKKIPTGKIPITNEEINNGKYYKSPFYHPSVMFRGEVIRKYKYNEDLVVAQDYALWFSILETYKGFNLKQRLLLYRDYPASITHTRKDIKQAVLIRIFADNLTNHDIVLSEQYVRGFILRNQKIDSDALNILLFNLFSHINNTNGYNFRILLSYFMYYLRHKNLKSFLLHLPLKDNILFFLKLIHYMIYRITIIIIKIME